MNRVFRLAAVAAALLVSTAPAVAQQISLQHFRGTCAAGAPGMCHQDSDCDVAGDCIMLVCAAGAVGAICVLDSDCDVAGRCDFGNVIIRRHHTIVSWTPPAVNPVDVYSGFIGPTHSKGNWVPGGPWTLNVTGCYWPDALGNSITINGDPHPAPGDARYFVVAEDGGIVGLPNINLFGCARPGICNNKGWCELGTAPGMPCNVPIDCPGAGSICAVGVCIDGEPALLNAGCNVDADCGVAGVCQARAVGTYCATDSGPADYGGCALHAVCVGGPNENRLCLGGADCPGGSCPAVAADTVTAGQLCYNAPPFGPGPEGCPAGGAGNPKRVLRVLSPAVIAACP